MRGQIRLLRMPEQVHHHIDCLTYDFIRKKRSFLAVYELVLR